MVVLVPALAGLHICEAFHTIGEAGEFIFAEEIKVFLIKDFAGKLRSRSKGRRFQRAGGLVLVLWP